MHVNHKSRLALAAVAALGLAAAQPAAAQINTLAKFNSANGSFPNSGVIFDSQGNLYGTTAVGGTSGGFGTIFEVKQGSSAITTLASFTGVNGVGPVGNLTLDSLGNLYGITPSGGATYGSGSGGLGYGAVFEAKKGSNSTYTITDLASFNGTNGANPQAGVIFDGSGNLYGTTYGPGTVFEIKKGSSAITTLASFNGVNGQNPFSSLTFDSLGNLYGTTYGGGTNNKGTIFEVAQGSNAITSLASFTGVGTDGANPQAAVAFDSLGNLYGTTTYGGLSGLGTVFELPKGSNTIADLASFTGANGANPNDGGLTVDSFGNLYGMTSGGGTSGDGTVFEVKSGSNAITSLASFTGANGANPGDGLTLDNLGNLYGTTATGGNIYSGAPYGGGTVFELNNPNPAVVLTPESSGLANLSGALLALALAGLVTAMKKKARRSR